MRLLGLILLIGGFLITIVSKTVATIGWVGVILGALVIVVSFLTKRK